MNTQYTVYYVSSFSKQIYRGITYRTYAEARGMFDQHRLATGSTEGLWLVEVGSAIEKKVLNDHKDYRLIKL